MTSRALPAALLACLAAAGCGGAEAPPERAAAPPRASSPPRAPDALPRSVPRDGTGIAPDEARRVVTRWLRELTRGDVEAAARVWALPSRFQNGTPVLRIDSEVERLAINASLPCGGRPTRIEGTTTPSYVVVTIRLTTRPGGGPPQGCDGLVRSAVQVRDGRITALFRLPEGGAPAPSGPQTEV
jgi:hypothetical protein